MPTPAERKALLFLALVATLGAGVRAARAARSGAEPDAGARRGLAAQLERVDSARAREGRRGKGGRAPKPRPKRARPRQVAGRGVTRDTAAGTGGHVPSLRSVPGAVAPLDVERATAEELDRLPGVGPALAGRIVASRDACGPFGSLDGLRRVKGVGERLAERLRPLVTFGAAQRPPSVTAGPCREGRAGSARGARRRTKPSGHGGV